jgi:crooked neck
VLEKRRGYYRGLLKEYPSNYDTWFDLIFLEQECKEIANVRDAFESAVKNVPPANEKRLWRRYIFLWIAYAIYEELEAKDLEKAKEVFSRVIKLIPHKIFTFSKIWIMYAQLLVRAKDLGAARKIFGQAIGMCPREKIFRSYIQLEMQLTNFDRCRMIYGKYLETFPDKPQIWVDFAEMENVL